MDSKTKPKTFGPVHVSFDGKGQILYAMIDPEKTSPTPPPETPVDMMIASLGACIVKSVQWAADQRKVALNPFSVTLLGTKSLEIPARIEVIDISVSGNVVDDEALSKRILKQAKAICTVSNSLNSQVNFNID